jgi:hypothetical protein
MTVVVPGLVYSLSVFLSTQDVNMLSKASTLGGAAWQRTMQRGHLERPVRLTTTSWGAPPSTPHNSPRVAMHAQPRSHELRVAGGLGTCVQRRRRPPPSPTG